MNRSQEAAKAAAETFGALAAELISVAEDYAASIPYQTDPDKVSTLSGTYERVQHVHEWLGKYLAMPYNIESEDA